MGWLHIQFSAVAGLALVVLVVLAVTSGPVSRERVQRFAERQRLVITPRNGEQVIWYLAVTRRWRVAGALCGLLGSSLLGIRNGTIGVNIAAIFGGWFVGAVIAEFRISGPPQGARRVASLQPRTYRRFMGSLGWTVLAATVGLCWAASLAHGVYQARLVWAIAPMIATVMAVVVWAVRRRVVDRPQPYSTSDELASDDAIRSRSIHVLCGSGLAVCILCLATQLSWAGPIIAFLATLAGLGIGYNVAIARFVVQPPSPPVSASVAVPGC